MHKNPIPTVDIIIEIQNGIVLVDRRNPPYGWAIPGGYVDYGECLEDAAIREAREETGLDIRLIRQFFTYSNPRRDSRHHTISTVFIGTASGGLHPGSDAKRARVFHEPWPRTLAFDHAVILADYAAWKANPLYHPLFASPHPL